MKSLKSILWGVGLVLHCILMVFCPVHFLLHAGGLMSGDDE